MTLHPLIELHLGDALGVLFERNMCIGQKGANSMAKLSEFSIAKLRRILKATERLAPGGEGARIIRDALEARLQARLNSLESEITRFERVWEMPAKYTFTMVCVSNLLKEEMNGGLWIDPFCGLNSPAQLRNDCNAEIPADAHDDGLDWLAGLGTGSADGAIFDPPYSVEMALRKYKAKFAGTAGRTEYHARCLDEIGRIVRPGGKAICFGWNSNGAGKKRGFMLVRVLLIAHGAFHQDTIVTVEKRVNAPLAGLGMAQGTPGQGELFLGDRIGGMTNGHVL